MTRDSAGHIDTLLGPDTVIRGDIRAVGGVRLDGQLEGNVETGEAFLAGQRSFLRGNLRCRSAVIAGRVEGDVACRETVELQAGAHVVGDISCRELVIQRGSYFQGNCTMHRDTETMSRQQEVT